MYKYYTGIGSRKTPENILKKFKDIATFLETKQYILRSGGAEGADSAFESALLTMIIKEYFCHGKVLMVMIQDIIFLLIILMRKVGG